MMTLDAPRGEVLGFYPETGEWKSVSLTDYPSKMELAQTASYNPRCTKLKYGQREYDCEALKAEFL